MVYAKDIATTVIEEKNDGKWLEDYKEVAPPSLNNRQLLIVEDDNDVREFLVNELRSYFEVVDVTNGEEAWRQIQDQRPDIILSDVAMPVMNGFELTQRIKKDASLSDIPVVLLTALTDDLKRERGFHVGADDYIQKPFSVRTLVARLSQLLEQRDKLRNVYSAVEAAPVVAVIKDERDKKFLTTLDSWIYSHMTDPTLNVDELARSLGFGRSSFYRKVNTLTGMTPNNYIRRIRMEKSKELLEETNLTISEVAYKTGFNSAFYFSKIFEDYYGMSPSHFRNGPKEK
ncbi:MAG: response regulator [Prevotella sp.]|nr:response regulator [Prevotella sp.]